MSGDDTETCGDEVEIACPWCGSKEWLADDQLWASSGFDCGSCDKPIKLRHDTSVTTWATRDEDNEDRLPLGSNAKDTTGCDV